MTGSRRGEPPRLAPAAVVQTVRGLKARHLRRVALALLTHVTSQFCENMAVAVVTKHDSIDDTPVVHVTNLTPGSECDNPRRVYGGRRQWMTPGMVHVTNLPHPGVTVIVGWGVYGKKHIQLIGTPVWNT